MPIKKICPRCHGVMDATKRYCDPCQAKVTAYNNKQYDKTKRNRKHDSFYHSPEWQAIREVVLVKSKRIDLFAYIVHKRIVPATTAHHIIELSEDWSKRLDIDNLIAVSESSHREIHKAYNKGGVHKANMIKILQRIVTSEYYGAGSL